ncbi:hypothetical protein LTR08_008291 [Meristemomyces frigidus]|nr:hypothetical protein LTR08_008291 [Meristemomyces frigidus]
MESQAPTSEVSLPRVVITYCTQCKWLLRAAYFGQELLSTFGTSLGEVALTPATGGLFTVYLTYKPDTEGAETRQVLLWDRKSEGGFPETKVLKQRVRDCIEPGRGLGHSDTPSARERMAGAKVEAAPSSGSVAVSDVPAGGGGEPVVLEATAEGRECEDCK